jgi:hypothetical protein
MPIFKNLNQWRFPKLNDFTYFLETLKVKRLFTINHINVVFIFLMQIQNFLFKQFNNRLALNHLPFFHLFLYRLSIFGTRLNNLSQQWSNREMFKPIFFLHDVTLRSFSWTWSSQNKQYFWLWFIGHLLKILLNIL